MPLQGRHDQRERARSFGAQAEEYDRYRTDYPPALARDLLADGRRTVLDIGCGTGKAAVLLAAEGAAVLGVEPDPRMAEVARRHGIAVETAPFEDWDARGRRFDVLTCASAWHWLDPAVTIPRIPELLNPGGLLARFWNHQVLDDAVVRALDAVYDDFPPALNRFGHEPSGAPEPPDPLLGVPELEVLPSRTYRWTATISTDTWTRRIATYSGHRRIGPTVLAALQARVGTVIDGFGGSITARCSTLCLLARRR